MFHVCESGKRQSSFLCPRGTIFNQKHRVCDWWYNVKCEDATEFYDLNLDLLLLDKGVSPTQATSLDVPPPIDAFSGLASNTIDNGLIGELPFDLLAGSDDELDGLILDDLVLANLLGKRRMDEGEDDYEDSQFLPDVIDVTLSPISKRLPSSVAAPVQPQPQQRRRKRRRKDRKRKKSRSRKNKDGNRKSGGGGGSLCQIMGICDSVPSATQENPQRSQHLPQSDVPFASSQVEPLFIEAPKEKRLGEKTAAEIAQLFLQSDNDDPMQAEDMEDSQFSASSVNTLSILPNPQPLQHSYQPESIHPLKQAEIDFNEGKQIKIQDDIPETYRMTHFGQDVSNLENYSNIPIASINFEDYKERESRMVPSESKGESKMVTSESKDSVQNSDFAQKSGFAQKTDFKLADYNMDREAKTWRPLRLNEEGEVERTNLSEPIKTTLTENDWIPKLGPDIPVRET